MKRIIPLAAGILFIASTVFFLTRSGGEQDMNTELAAIPDVLHDYIQPHEEEKKEIKYFEQFSKAVRANQHTGTIDINDVLAAKQEAAKLRERSGGRGSLNLVWEEMGPNNKGGRTRAVIFDKNNPSRMYAGGVTGGLWLSTNGGSSWSNYTGDDTLAGVGVGSIVQAGNGDIYVGTGERWGANASGGITNFTVGFVGEGIWKSSDGVNFTHLPATSPTANNATGTDFAFVNTMAAHPTDGNTVLAGTNRGIWITSDAGASWAPYTNGPLKVSNIQDLEITSDGILIASVGAGSASYYRGNVDDPNSVINKTGSGGFPNASIGLSRMLFAWAKSDANYIYMISCNSDGETNAIYRSTDKGENWASIAPGLLPTDGFNPTGEQGDYDMEIAVNPADKDRIYVGGQFQVWEWTYTHGWYPISSSAGSSASNPYHVHVDHHRIAFHPTNPDVMVMATDGGMYRTNNARVNYPNVPSWHNLNKDYAVAQFYSVSAGLDGAVMGGTQDNRTILVDGQGNTKQEGRSFLVQNIGCDGGYTEIAKTNPNAIFASCQFGRLGRAASRDATNLAGYFDSKIDAVDGGDGLPDCGASGIAVPFRLWENMDNNDPGYGEGRMVLGTDCGIWLGTDVLNFGSAPTWFHISRNTSGWNGVPTTIELTADGDIAYAGTSNGNLYRVSGLRNAVWEYDDNGTPTIPGDDFFDLDSAGIVTTRIANFAGRWITSIAADKNNNNKVVVTLGQYGNNHYVYRSNSAATDPQSTGTGTFTSIQGNLPKMPVYSSVIDYYNGNNIILGTELGIYSTNNGITWQPESQNMPYTANFMLRQEMIDRTDNGCYALYVGTYGRGIFRSTTLTPTSCNVNVGIPGTHAVVANSVSVYPNPVNSTSKYKVEFTRSEKATVHIYDMQGRELMQKNIGMVEAGVHHFNLNTSALANGNYFLIVRTDDSQSGVQFVVTR